MSVSAIDLFCGIGGLTHGLINSGIPVVAGIDLDSSCKYAYEANNESKFFCEDITEVEAESIVTHYPEGNTRVLVGCAPCQPFSQHTQKNKTRSQEDEWRLLDSFARLIAEIQPTIISMENVYELSATQVFLDFLDTLSENGYYYSWSKVYCPDYGIPQSRKRLVLLASLLGNIDIIPPTHKQIEYRNVQETIGHLESIQAGDVSTTDPIHRASALNDTNLRRIRSSKPGGTWRDWDDELLAECHRKDTGKSYSGVYARMKYDEVSPTITTQFYNYGTGRFGHPIQNRALSLREGALLQTFPSDYKFVKDSSEISIKRLGRHIGNAVPPRLGTIIGLSIKRHLQQYQVDV